MINEQYKHSELTGKIIGASMEVHTILGNGFQETNSSSYKSPASA